VITRSKVIHISCHGKDNVRGTLLEFETEDLIGKFQGLTKKVIGKEDFKDKNDDIRVIVLSACQSQRIG
jgi:CHAT domain-containing protein